MVNSPLTRPYLLEGVALGGYLRFPWFLRGKSGRCFFFWGGVLAKWLLYTLVKKNCWLGIFNSSISPKTDPCMVICVTIGEYTRLMPWESVVFGYGYTKIHQFSEFAEAFDPKWMGYSPRNLLNVGSLKMVVWTKCPAIWCEKGLTCRLLGHLPLDLRPTGLNFWGL